MRRIVTRINQLTGQPGRALECSGADSPSPDGELCYDWRRSAITGFELGIDHPAELTAQLSRGRRGAVVPLTPAPTAPKTKEIAVEVTTEQRMRAAVSIELSANPGLTREAAYVEVLKKHPEWFPELAVIESPGLPASTRMATTPSTTAALDLAITAELKANPKLTRPQAYAAALDKNPRLYDDFIAERA